MQIFNQNRLMFRSYIGLTLLILILMISFNILTQPIEANSDTVVNIPDQNLEAVIREMLDKPTGDLTIADMEWLPHLVAQNKGVTNLTGLEYATNLDALHLDNNNISDISPLAGLTKLRNLSLDHNKISDISILANLSNLEALVLDSNKISNISPLSGLTKLSYHLSLHDNNISNISPLSGLTNLEYLSLGKNSISDLSPLSSLENLERLLISDNIIHDIFPLLELGNVKFIGISSNYLDLKPRVVTFDLNGAPGHPPVKQYFDTHTMNIIYQLTAHGVEIIYSPQKTIPYSYVDETSSLGFITKPPDPVWPSYYFGGWYPNPDGSGVAEFHYLNNYQGWPVKGDLTLYAKWKGLSTIDHYDFPHSGSFTTSSYRINNDYYAALIEGTNLNEFSKINNSRYRTWNGSCSGMGISMIYFNKGELNPYIYEDGKEHIIELKTPPKDNLKLESLINYYHLAQHLSFNVNQYTGLEELVNAVSSNEWTLISVQRYSSQLIGMKPEDGHLVIGYNVRDRGDDYRIDLVESNCQNHKSYMLVSKDYKNATLYTPSWTLYNDISTINGTLDFGKIRNISIYDHINPERRVNHSNIPVAAHLQDNLQNAEEIVTLTTNYHSFIITDQQGNTAEVNGTEITGNIDISKPYSDVGPGFEQIRNNYDLSEITGYTIEPLDELDQYETEMFYDTSFGCYGVIKTEKPGAVTFMPNGEVSGETEQVGTKKISTTINSTITPWYTVEVEANLKDLTLTPSPENNVISSTEPLGAVNVTVYNYFDQIPLSLDTSETSVVVKNTPSESSGQTLSITTSGDIDSNLTITDQHDTVLASTPVTYYVNFRTYGGTPIDTIRGIPYNSLVDKPEDPTLPGFIFSGWYKDAECTDGEEWDFTTERVNRDTTIHAKWEQDENFLHEVRFKAEGFDDMVIIVYDGDSIETTPEVPEKEGYSGIWDTSDFTNIQEDLLVNAIYTVLPEKDSNLLILDVSEGTLTPPFELDTIYYSVNVAHDLGTIEITATLSNPEATMTFNGDPADSGEAKTIILNGPGTETKIKVFVTAKDGETEKTYTISVNRAAEPGSDANLSNLMASLGSLVPVFDPDTTDYSVEVAHDVETIDVTATLSDKNATMTINDDPSESGDVKTIALNDPGTATPIEIVITAEDGVTQNTYTIAVSRLESTPSFTDVTPEMQFYPYIEAIYAEGITTGYGDGTYRPNDHVNRGQMAAFIARALVLPEAGDPDNPSFTDVSPAMQFFSYIEAIYAEDITTGYGDGTYRPNDTVTRGQMAAFLARALELPDAGDPNNPSFTDVTPNMQFFSYIEAIYGEGITTGYGDGTFRPNDPVNRGQMAAFLSRALGLH